MLLNMIVKWTRIERFKMSLHVRKQFPFALRFDNQEKRDEIYYILASKYNREYLIKPFSSLEIF